jgi:hypothetical protein
MVFLVYAADEDAKAKLTRPSLIMPPAREGSGLPASQERSAGLVQGTAVPASIIARVFTVPSYHERLVLHRLIGPREIPLSEVNTATAGRRSGTTGRQTAKVHMRMGR